VLVLLQIFKQWPQALRLTTITTIVTTTNTVTAIIITTIITIIGAGAAADFQAMATSPPPLF
jgi:hypothetical protein